MGKPIDKTNTLLEDMALNNFHWASVRGNSIKQGRHEVDAFNM